MTAYPSSTSLDSGLWRRDSILRQREDRFAVSRDANDPLGGHLPFSPSRQAMTSSSPRTASSTRMTGCASNTNAGSIEQNLCTVSGSSHSTNIWPPHSPTRITKNSILKLAGAFHWPNTSRIRFWAFSYSIGEPCGRSNQLMMYFMDPLFTSNGGLLTTASVYSVLLLRVGLRCAGRGSDLVEHHA